MGTAATPAEKLEKRREAKRVARLAKRGGCTPEQKQNLIAEQLGRCAICDRHGVTLFVDHCHVTDTVRAALCQGCNLALGHARDNPMLLRKMADYLDAHRDWRHEYHDIHGCLPGLDDVA